MSATNTSTVVAQKSPPHHRQATTGKRGKTRKATTPQQVRIYAVVKYVIFLIGKTSVSKPRQHYTDVTSKAVCNAPCTPAPAVKKHLRNKWGRILDFGVILTRAVERSYHTKWSGDAHYKCRY